ncbi:septal ring lytic transglycosylase RlpA family protein [Rhizosaccharibacter radicis]|uniref:Endolytic peptidoglycan transglycosylase RlpA n=1 Tax=Rhizosaccharibacter radicis TaxID=2782605 RepID=A0ABT1W035_9PROT|nr:septal ring lytic transglycosylase RlpA family protein [Acetobacteraceae bacterium KSS12]
MTRDAGRTDDRVTMRRGGHLPAGPVLSRFAGFCVGALVMLPMAAWADSPAAVAPSAVSPATVVMPRTSWAGSVIQHLSARGLLHEQDAAAAPSVSPAGAARPAHPVTSWAHAVEEHLAARAHRAAEAGRSALAWSENGIASWYGGRWAGRATSSGTRYDPAQMTCAHPSLPLGSKVRVTSDVTGESVVVTVNDRGPHGRGRIIDLSRAAAARIGMLGSGTASVTLEKLADDAPVEVAEAPAGDDSAQAIAAANIGTDDAAATRPPRGRRHKHHGAR